MLKFSAVLSALGIAPKTLPQASETLTEARAQLDSVNALFTAAGLNLEQMLAAGPDSLKAHLDGRDNTAEVTRLTGELNTLTQEITAANGRLEVAGKQVLALNGIATAVGLKVEGTTRGEDITNAFAAHVSKQTTLALAKTGHPPAHVPAADTTPAGAAKTNAEVHAEWKAMKPSPARLDFFSKHEAAITAHERQAA